jgi:hypothetical protein
MEGLRCSICPRIRPPARAREVVEVDPAELAAAMAAEALQGSASYSETQS